MIIFKLLAPGVCQRFKGEGSFCEKDKLFIYKCMWYRSISRVIIYWNIPMLSLTASNSLQLMSVCIKSAVGDSCPHGLCPWACIS